MATIQPQGCYVAAPQRPANTETYPIILPLSLVRRLVGKLNHPRSWDNFLVYFSHKCHANLRGWEFIAELKELDPPKRLGKLVRKLVLGVDVACLDAPFLQTASDEVVPHPDVLTPFMENGVLCQG